MNNIEKNRRKILENINKSHSLSLYQDSDLPKLIAISKKQNEERVLQALQSGHRVFGENMVQEAENRWSKHFSEFQNIELHLVGSLQTNKVKKALKLFDVIHSIDRQSLAIEISKNLDKPCKTKTFFIQVNTGREKQKSGVLPEDIDDFFNFCKNKLKIHISGLMCIPPVSDTPGIHFCYLNHLAKKLDLKTLSMGMSSDYEEAIKFGSTHLRIGEDFFGKRF